MSSKTEFHEDFSREEKVKGSSTRTFGLAFAIFFALLGALAGWKSNPHWIWWIATAIFVLAIALARPALLNPLNRIWTLLGLLLFRVISPITLGIIFYAVMAPMGMLLRWRGKDILR